MKFVKNVIHNTIETELGSVTFDDVVFNPSFIEDKLYKYVLSKENLCFIFNEPDVDNNRLKNMYRRFRGTRHIDDVKTFVDSGLTSNSSFYSFLAEATLPIVYRDVYNYDLIKAAVDIDMTLVDTSTGPDDCLIDYKNKRVILGEAKFRNSFDDCLNDIRSDFTKSDSIINKLENLFLSSTSRDNIKIFLLENLSSTEMEELTIEKFLEQEIVFCGFAIHELGKYSISDFSSESFYKRRKIDIDNLYSIIKKKYSILGSIKYRIIIFHLVINSKKDLIAKTIEFAQTEMEKL